MLRLRKQKQIEKKNKMNEKKARSVYKTSNILRGQFCAQLIKFSGTLTKSPKV